MQVRALGCQRAGHSYARRGPGFWPQAPPPPRISAVPMGGNDPYRSVLRAPGRLGITVATVLSSLSCPNARRVRLSLLKDCRIR